MMTSFKLKEALCWLNETRRILTLVKVSIPVKKAKKYFDEYRQLNYRKPATYLLIWRIEEQWQAKADHPLFL